MPISALPEGYQLGPDNQGWLMRLKKKIQFALAAGPRASGFWKWREIPITLFETHGQGVLRIENTDGTSIQRTGTMRFLNNDKYYYLSRIQPWTRYHVALQWPLFFNCHVIYREKDVAEYPKYQSSFGICKMATFGVGFKRDSDKVYWLTANAGGNFE